MTHGSVRSSLFQLDTDEFYGRSNANAGVVR